MSFEDGTICNLKAEAGRLFRDRRKLEAEVERLHGSIELFADDVKKYDRYRRIEEAAREVDRMRETRPKPDTWGMYDAGEYAQERYREALNTALDALRAALEEK